MEVSVKVLCLGVPNSNRRSDCNGFTLVELIAVIVIVGITAAIGAGVITQTFEQYHTVQGRTALAMRGSVVMEQVTRQLGTAAPFSLRVSPLGRCIEYIPVVSLVYLAEEVNRAPDRLSHTVQSHAFQLNAFQLNTAKSILIAPHSSSEVYSWETVSVHARINQLTPIAHNNSSSAQALAASKKATHRALRYYRIDLARPHQFLRGDHRQTAWLTASAQRFCVKEGELWHFTDYGSAPLTDFAPANAQRSLLADNLAVEGMDHAFFRIRQYVDVDVDVLSDDVIQGNHPDGQAAKVPMIKPPYALVSLTFLRSGERLLLTRAVFPRVDGAYEEAL